MILENDIIGKVLYLHGLRDLIVVAESESEKESPIRCTITGPFGDTLLDETYWFDFSGTISIDIKDAVSSIFVYADPAIGEEVSHSGLGFDFSIDIGDGSIAGSFTINAMSENARLRTSDIDMLRIPYDYILPLSIHDFVERSGVEFVSPAGTLTKPDWLQTSGTGKGSRTRFVEMSGASERLKRSFHVLFLGTTPSITTPQFRLCSGHFEQYLFANRYGGYDNIPMDGELLYEPETEYETGLYHEQEMQITAKCTDRYTQNSGYVTRKTVEAMKELIRSRQIFHLKDGTFRKIVILESDISMSSVDSIHSFSFQYRYADIQSR